MEIFKTKIYFVGPLKVKMCVDMHICGFYVYIYANRKGQKSSLLNEINFTELWD